MDSAKIPQTGSKAPDFQSITSEGRGFSLSAALEQGKNICLVFYRGHW